MKSALPGMFFCFQNLGNFFGVYVLCCFGWKMLDVDTRHPVYCISDWASDPLAKILCFLNQASSFRKSGLSKSKLGRRKTIVLYTSNRMKWSYPSQSHCFVIGSQGITKSKIQTIPAMNIPSLVIQLSKNY